MSENTLNEDKVLRTIIDYSIDGYNVAEIQEAIFDMYNVKYPKAYIENLLETNRDLYETRRTLKSKALRENIYESLKKLKNIIGVIEDRIIREQNNEKLSRNLIMLLEQYRQVIKDLEVIKGNLTQSKDSIDILRVKEELSEVLPVILTTLESEGKIKILQPIEVD